MKVLLNGHIQDARAAVVSVFDHGFLYGDGVYETVRAYDYRISHWPEHYHRLKESARCLALRCPWSRYELEQWVIQLLRANHKPDAAVRISISRGPGALGLDPGLCSRPNMVMLLHPDRPVERWRRRGVSVGIVQTRRNHPLCLDPRIKANNALNTILAKMEGKRLGVFESILLNLDGYLTEGTTTNLFFVRRKTLYTPSLACGLLEGVTRGALIHIARKNGFKVLEGAYQPNDLARADEIFLSSTTLEIMPVQRVVQALSRGPKTIWRGPVGPVMSRLYQLFCEHRRHQLTKKVLR